MNEINFDQDAKVNGSKNLRSYILDRKKELELFVVLVVLGIAAIILFGVLSDSKSLELTGLLSYLVIALLFIVFYSVITTKTTHVSITYQLKEIIRRLLDIVLAFVGLYLLSPFFLFLAIAVRMESPGPILFYTTRLGQYGKPVRVLNFRTMQLAPEGELTKVGNFLRQTHLDKFPQLWNVLIGDMSLVDASTNRTDDSGL
jgi:hypothetical protein